MGYITAYVIQLSGSAVICAVIYTINSLFFGVCLYIGVFLRDLHQTYHRIDKLYTTNSIWFAHKFDGAENSSNLPNNNKTKTSQLNDRAIGSFDGRLELGRINQATTLIKKFVEDHNDILRWIEIWTEIEYNFLLCVRGLVELWEVSMLIISKQFNRFAEKFAQLTSGMIFVTFVLSISWICTSFFQIHSVSVSLFPSPPL